jgi:hypothetical protein
MARKKKIRTKPRKQKRKLTAADRKRRRETMMIFVNGKQKRVPRPKPELTEAELFPCGYDEYFSIQNDLWEYYRPPPILECFEICYENDGEICNGDEAEPESFEIQISLVEVNAMLRAEDDSPF